MVFRRREAPPASSAVVFLALYWGAAIVSTLVGIAAMTAEPLTGVLHAARLIRYRPALLFFYSELTIEDLPRFVEVIATSVLLI